MCRVEVYVAMLIRILGAGMGWLVSATPWTFYPQERPDTHCSASRVGLGISLEASRYTG